MGYYLLDNPNPNGPHYYTSRRRPLVGIVVHCTAGLEDLDGGVDHSAERTAEYAASTSRVVSWHSGSDTDTCFELLPASYTAFQTRGYNSSTYGHEISKRNMIWEGMPADWVTATLEQPAAHLHKIATDAGIPIRRIGRPQLDRARAAGDPSQGGFIGHRELDPTRRTDPGADFPWTRFLDLVRGDDDMTKVPQPTWAADSVTRLQTKGHITQIPEVATREFWQVLVAIDRADRSIVTRLEDWVRDHVKSSIAAAVAGGAGLGNVDYPELIRQIGETLAGG